MTCYDCIHCDACSDAGDSGYSSLKEDASKCKHFKNKADFVEVVRCKDCQYVHINSSSEKYHCKRRGYYSEEVKPTGFCSYGVKGEKL